PGTTAPVPIAPPEAQVQLKPLPEYINKYNVSERPRPNGRIDKYYQHKELNLNFRSLAEVERYESRGIYPGCAKKRKENEDQIGLHEPLLALTYEGTEQLTVEESDASTKEIIIYENIENLYTYNSPRTRIRIPQEQCHIKEPCNNMYMPNRATALAPKETTGYIIQATPISTLHLEAQAPTPKRRYNKKYHHKERNITLRSLLEVKRNETDYIFPVRGKKKKGSNDQSESPASLLLLTYGETGEQNEELEASTMERTNSENMHMSDLTASASTAPKASKHGRKRKIKTVVSSEAEANIGVEQNGKAAPIDVPINDEAASIDVLIIDEASLIDVPINDQAAPIDVPIIDEATLIDVPITYVENFSDLG
ncbi:hypothetical protein Godav_011657, partial [Gossypium davidsonii]|nr:hypothetical protein [Gossypium davidsonii]